MSKEDFHFLHSTVSKLADSTATETAETDENPELMRQVMQVRALVGRLSKLNSPDNSKELNSSLSDPVQALLDQDLVLEVDMATNPTLAQDQEYQAIEAEIKDLLGKPKVLETYREMFTNWATNLHQFKKVKKAYKTGTIEASTINSDGKTVTTETIHTIDEGERVLLARQMIRLLDFFRGQIEEEIQNVYNQVAAAKREFSESDEAVLAKLHDRLLVCKTEMDTLLQENHEVAIEQRSEQVKSDSRILQRVAQEDPRQAHKWQKQGGYIETQSRAEMIYGNDDAQKFIMGSLRSGNNVELTGPTGTGKTKIAIHATKVFAQKNPVVVSGGPGVYRSTFYGSATGLDKRNRGMLVQCIEEDRCMIIDEDNRVDPRQMAEIKMMLGLKPGDEWIHPDTGNTYTIPPHFRVIVTRNERGRHHKDRFDLPPEYRREFTHGSYEVDYYTPEEMYERFLLPKLANPDGSISLSKEEIGGDIEDANDTSPLLALVLAAAKIQAAYKENELSNAVFESGYMIGLLDPWKEIQFKTSETGEKISFLNFLETKLLDFVKRSGIGNQDRRKIVGILFEHGFFRSYGFSDFSTANDGSMFEEQAFLQLMNQNNEDIFKSPSGIGVSTREVALLDPFHTREIEIPPHPLETEINDFSSNYLNFCREANIRPVVFSSHDIDIKKEAIVKSIKDALEDPQNPLSQKPNIASAKAMLVIMEDESLTKFLDQMTKILQILNNLINQ